MIWRIDMCSDNLNMLRETLSILDTGAYYADGKKVLLPHTKEVQTRAQVFLPEDIVRIRQTNRTPIHAIGARCRVRCENKDSFTAARELLSHAFPWSDQKQKPQEILVLNFANPSEPGGGVRRGARAQEEDLCRKSSLLLSLESKAAEKYYHYHHSLHSWLSSDAMIITPKVDVFRDETGALLPEPVTVAVMTCAAPMVENGYEGLTEEGYRSLFSRRIDSIFQVAAFLGYQGLVLGAFGCGAFGNDAAVVSDLFYKCMKEFRFSGMRLEDCFRIIDFAVLSRSAEQYNFKEFLRNFDNFYRDEDAAVNARVREQINETEKYLNAIRGCLIGGAAGDALGYAVEFVGEDYIFNRYGPTGITSFALESVTGKAVISDDTQMTLFTAIGLLFGQTRMKLRGIGVDPWYYVAMAYQDWLRTQETDFYTEQKQHEQDDKRRISWLLDVPELFALRAPGNTCLSALRSGGATGDPLKNPINHSKGCGGVMRVAPVALAFPSVNVDALDKEAANVAAITHGHSLGWLPAAVMVHIIHRLVFGTDGLSLKELTIEARNAVRQQFKDDPNIQQFCALLDLTVELSENTDNDLPNIHRLGEGWVGDEALAIALYCCLRYPDDFSKAIITAVNHKGDSDSTGAIAGNILGAKLGMSAIDEKWIKDLELADVILEVADDLCHGCQMSEYSPYRDPAWETKYIYHRRFTIFPL